MQRQENAKQRPEAEIYLFGNYSHSSFTLSSKNNRTYSKKSKKVSVSLFMRLRDLRLQPAYPNVIFDSNTDYKNGKPEQYVKSVQSMELHV